VRLAPAQLGRADPFFLHKETGALHPRTPELIEQVAKRVEQTGIEAWFSLDAKELLGDEADQYRKMSDTLDVWFDSGTTHLSVMRGSHAEQCDFPADLYLEGSDQHRGWFQSSLLTGCAIDGRAPYKALLTHGFVVDGKGLKMSKSKGNVIAPQKVSDTLGADILRLWDSRTDYSGELSISDEILKRVVEAYRRIRNTLRFLLANTSTSTPPRTCCRSPVAGNRPLRAGHDAPDAAGAEADYGKLRIPPRRAGAADLLFGRSRRLLPRHPQGPPVHHGRRFARPPLGAERAVAHHAELREADGADSFLYGRRGLAAIERGRRRVGDAGNLAAAAGANGRIGTGRQVGADSQCARRSDQGAGRPAH
jgi:hypothetical protein